MFARLGVENIIVGRSAKDNDWNFEGEADLSQFLGNGSLVITSEPLP